MIWQALTYTSRCFIIAPLYMWLHFSGTQWLHSRVEFDGYEEYSGTEYHSAGWSEEYNVIE